MLWPHRLFPDCQRPLIQGLGFGLPAHWEGKVKWPPPNPLQNPLRHRRTPDLAAGMLGGESPLPEFYERLYPPLIKYYGFTEEELSIFIIHIEGDTEHMEEGKSLVRRLCVTQEQRERFMDVARVVRDRLWESWDAMWEAMELDLPQDVYPRHAMFASRERDKAA